MGCTAVNDDVMRHFPAPTSGTALADAPCVFEPESNGASQGKQATGGRRRLLQTRHRLQHLGAQALNEVELLGLIAGLDEAEALESLREASISDLCAESLDALTTLRGLSAAAAERLLAAAELARRLPASRQRRPRLETPDAIYRWLRRQFLGLRRESFHVLCLNSRNVLLRQLQVAQGSVDQCHVDPREALAPAVACRATNLVLVHNHPSGDPEPSIHDVTLTRQLREGAGLLCIRLIDHLVLGESGYVSMSARGLLGADSGVLLSHLNDDGH